MKKVIFYPGPIHLFWTTGIYYVDELSKYFEVTLVLEKATKEDEEKINYLTENRLKKIYHIKYANKLRRHWIYKNTAIKLVKEIKPDFVFADNDMFPFNTYLLYYAKKGGTINICYQTGFIMGRRSECREARDILKGAKIQNRLNIPFYIAILLGKIMDLLKHHWHYFIAPILIGHSPFFGPSSVYTIKGRCCMRDGDYFIVFSERERRICILDGLPEDKIIIVSHPLAWKSNKGFKNQLLNYHTTKIDDDIMSIEENNIVIFLSNLEQGIDRKTKRLTKKGEIFEMWKRIIETISKKYTNYTIFIKSHPILQPKDDSFRYIQFISQQLPNTKLVDKDKDAMYYVSRSKVIISEVSTILYISSLLFDNKMIISLDLCDRYLGDVYKETKNINYISNLKDLKALDFDKKEKILLSQYDGSKILKEFLSSMKS